VPGLCERKEKGSSSPPPPPPLDRKWSSYQSFSAGSFFAGDLFSSFKTSNYDADMGDSTSLHPSESPRRSFIEGRHEAFERSLTASSPRTRIPAVGSTFFPPLLKTADAHFESPVHSKIVSLFFPSFMSPSPLPKDESSPGHSSDVPSTYGDPPSTTRLRLSLDFSETESCRRPGSLSFSSVPEEERHDLCGIMLHAWFFLGGRFFFSPRQHSSS